MSGRVVPGLLSVLWGVLLSTLGGCGDLSQEDLLFRLAVPPREAVAVTPPGSASNDGSSRTQALEIFCVEGDLRCEAQKIATDFNALTFGLLDVVDLLAGLPPTLREPGRRVWGPHFDRPRNQTFRFEMVREDDDITFSFCLFAAQGQVDGSVGGRELNCSSDDGVLVNVFSGSFQPSGIAGDAARLGEGTMRFEADKASGLDGSTRIARVLDFAFNNKNERTDIQVDVIGITTADDERDAAYDFQREADGSGTFLFDVFDDLVKDEVIPVRLEHIRLAARWNAEQAGRALGVVDEGSIAAGTEFAIEQCWGPAPRLETVYFDGVDDADPPVGVEGDCAFEAAELIADS